MTDDSDRHGPVRSRPKLFICGCGAGELTAWVTPLLRAMAHQALDWEVSVVFWPRLFLSDREVTLAREMVGVSQVYSPRAALRLLLSRAGSKAPPAVILHMGAKPELSLRLGKRQHAPVIAYTDRAENLPGGFTARYSSAALGAGSLGNLLVDAVADIRAERLQNPPDADLVGLMPGSRAIQLRVGLPMAVELVDRVAVLNLGIRFQVARSPLATEAVLRQALQGSKGACLETDNGNCVIVTPAGNSLPIGDREQVLARSRFLICPPGTNTGEVAALGIPHLVVAPFDVNMRLFTGWLGVLESLPWPTLPLKRLILRRLAGSVQYYALANQCADRVVVPEQTGSPNVALTADKLMTLWSNGTELERMARELTDIMGPSGAAESLLRKLEQQIRTRTS